MRKSIKEAKGSIEGRTITVDTYEVMTKEKKMSVGEKMTLRDALDLWWNSIHTNAGSYYKNYDGFYVDFDDNEVPDDVLNSTIQLDEYWDEDLDGYPIIGGTFVDGAFAEGEDDSEEVVETYTFNEAFNFLKHCDDTCKSKKCGKRAVKEELRNVADVEEKSKEIVNPDFAAAVRDIKKNDKARDAANKFRKSPIASKETLPKDLKPVTEAIYVRDESEIKEGDYIIFNTIDDELADWKEQHPSKNGYKVVHVDRETDGSPTGMYFVKGCPVAIDSAEDEIYKIDVKELKKGTSIKEDTVKQAKYWVNKGKEGTHGKFRTKKGADAQRKAMFANGYKESVSKPKEERKSDLEPAQKFLRPAMKDFVDRHEKAGKKVPKYIQDYAGKKGERRDEK